MNNMNPETRIALIIYAIFGFLLLCKIVKSIKLKIYKNNILELKYSDSIKKYLDLIVQESSLNSIRIIRAFLFILGIILVIGGLFVYSNCQWLALLIIASGLVLIIYRYNGKYDKIFKDKIVPLAIKEYNDKFFYHPNDSIDELEYKMTWTECADIFNGEDRIDGKIMNFPFTISDVHTKQIKTDSDGKKYEVTIFNGSVAKVTIDQYINLDLVIMNTNTRGLYMNHVRSIDIDNPELEEFCNIYTNNEVKAFSLLKPSFTNKLLDLYNYYKIDFDILINDNTIWFRFNKNKLFNPNYNAPIKEAYGIALYFQLVEFIKDLTKEIIESIKDLES